MFFRKYLSRSAVPPPPFGIARAGLAGKFLPNKGAPSPSLPALRNECFSDFQTWPGLGARTGSKSGFIPSLEQEVVYTPPPRVNQNPTRYRQSCVSSLQSPGLPPLSQSSLGGPVPLASVNATAQFQEKLLDFTECRVRWYKLDKEGGKDSVGVGSRSGVWLSCSVRLMHLM